MSIEALESDGNPYRDLTMEDYNSEGELKTLEADLALVVGSASKSEQWIAQKQWALLWRDADLLYQSPRPMSVYENTYVLEPNVQRFTVAKVVNAVIPSLYKGLFYQDPPMILRPRPGTSQTVIDAKTAIFSQLLDACGFKREVKWGLEGMGNLGTGIWKWGIKYETVITQRRIADGIKLPAGPGTTKTESVSLDNPPKIITSERVVPRPFFENRQIDRVLVDSKTEVGDIRFADAVTDVRYMDFYQMKELAEGIEALPEDDPEKEEWFLPSVAKIKDWWNPPTKVAPTLSSDQASTATGAVHHAEKENIQTSPDILLEKKEILEYWSKSKKITVIDRTKVIRTGKNQFGVIPFLSANWWNRPKAFYGMGLGLIIGQNQRVDQGTINSILKILSFGVNPIYLRSRVANAPTQMIRTGLGKILTVDGEIDKAYKLLDTPKIPTEIWSALSESEKATESTSGADQMLVQGSSAGPRSSMGRTAGGAGILANASATRLDGPLDNFIEQVFKPWLYILDMLVFRYISDHEIMQILGDELGKDYVVDMQKFHDAKIEFEVLAGSSLAAKRTMAQSMTLITQIFENPNIQQNLAEINGEYIDFKTILNMWMEASEWKDRQDIIKPLTAAMKQRMAQKSQAAQANSKLQTQMQLNAQKGQINAQKEQEAADARLKKDLILEAFRANASSEDISGEPSSQGLEGETPEVQ